ncbi:hypothetical protein T02_7776 [Trichinella nativa]|uniref:Uncharacterized protein n=1 Tax=Trichinella nativa TaxID=6335 RepID=A0A0V1LHU0_9BILA|nr:hypothetical protein T02_7776 [Trichinella nativa]
MAPERCVHHVKKLFKDLPIFDIEKFYERAVLNVVNYITLTSVSVNRKNIDELFCSAIRYSDFIQIEFTLFAQRCVLAQQFQISIIESLHQTFCPKLVQLSQFDNAIMLEEKHA